MELPIIFNLKDGDLIKIAHHFELYYHTIGIVIDSNSEPRCIKVRFEDVNNEEKELWFHSCIGNAIQLSDDRKSCSVLKDCDDAAYYPIKEPVYPHEEFAYMKLKEEKELAKAETESKSKKKPTQKKKIN